MDHVLHFIGSRTVLQKYLKNQEFRNLLRIFSLASDREDILQAGEKILLLLGGKRKKTPYELCVHKYHKKMPRKIQHSTKVEARAPTSDAAEQHTL